MKLNLNTGLSALPKIGAGTGPAPWANTYSTDFDGTDDYIDCGDITAFNGATEMSCFAWVKINTLVTDKGIMAKWDYQTQGCFALQTGGSDELRVFIASVITSAGGEQINTTDANLVAGTWYHIGFVYDGSLTNANRVKIYVDGVVKTSTVSGITATSLTTATSSFKIGKFGGALPRNIDANIDEVSVFDEALASSKVTDLYNSGTPTNLASESGLIAWYRMGDSAVFNADSQWEFPEQTKINNWSSHSFEFDGVNDRVDFGSTIDLGTTSSESFWLKQDTPTAAETIIGIPIATVTNPGNSYHLYLHTGGEAYVRVGNYFWLFDDAATKTAINTTDWIHMAIIRTGVTTCILYVNGVDNDGVQTNASLSGDTQISNLGCQDNDWFDYQGLIDDYACFDTALTYGNVTSIYADGVPNDVSDLGISGLVAYYRMGEGASFAGGSWTIPDVSTNSNDGTSSGMNEADNINNAPDNENQGLSVGMISGSVVEETP